MPSWWHTVRVGWWHAVVVGWWHAVVVGWWHAVVVGWWHTVVVGEGQPSTSSRYETQARRGWPVCAHQDGWVRSVPTLEATT
jgi:hypothetical protein